MVERLKSKSMMSMVSPQTSLRKYFHGAVIDMANLGSVNRCLAVKHHITFLDCAHITFRSAKYLVDKNMQPFLRVSFQSDLNFLASQLCYTMGDNS